MKTTLLLIGLLFTLGSPLCAQGGQATSQWKIDWEKGLFSIEITAPLPKDEAVLPINRFKTEQMIQQILPERLAQSLLEVQVDSRTTIEDIVQEFPDLFQILSDLSLHLTQDFSRASTDYSRISIQFSLPLFPFVARLFPGPRVPNPIPRVLGYRATREFSGVVIHARNRLPVHGTTGFSPLVPSLFPQIWDEEMNPLLSRSMMDSEIIHKWGVSAYSYGYSETPYRDRIGENPLRITARALFGQQPSDLIISSRDAQKLLTSEHNRNLLREGRLLILLDPQAP